MGYVKTQADNALKAGNYKDAYTKCVIMTLPALLSRLPSCVCLSLVYERKRKKKVPCV